MQKTEDRKNKIRIVIGIILIVVGIASLLLWELWGREYITYEYVIVAAKDIKPGEIIDRDKLKEKSFCRDSTIKNAIDIDTVDKIIGKVSKNTLKKGSQLHECYFTDNRNYVRKGQSIFKLPAEWMEMRSSSIRKGDIVEIFGEDGKSLGKYTVAFVKDAQEREVVSIEEGTEKNVNQEVLERTEGTGVINSIEIIATLKQYEEISKRAATKKIETGEVLGEKFVVTQVLSEED